MNTILFTDEKFKQTESYKKFMNNNPDNSFLKIQASKANSAMPVEGVEVIVSHIIDEYKVIFFDGETNESGIIENISLPVPKKDNNDLDIPLSTTYNIEAIYTKENIDVLYKAKMFSGANAIQNIDINPNIESWDI